MMQYFQGKIIKIKMPVNQVKSTLTGYCPPGGQEQFKTNCYKEKGVWIMKKKIYIIGVMTVLAITSFGCGGKKDAANNDKVAEATTEEITTETTERVTEQSGKKKAEKTTEATTEKVSENKKSEKSDKKKSDSKTDKSKAANTAAQSDKAVTQPANNSKDVVTTTTNSSTSNNTSANNTSQTTQTSSKPQTTECQHNWIAVTHTVHHDAVMGERIVESAVYAHWYCRDCQKYYISVWDDPCGAANGSDASYCLKPAVRETYEVTPAYDETVTDYYKCSKCGATR